MQQVILVFRAFFVTNWRCVPSGTEIAQKKLARERKACI